MLAAQEVVLVAVFAVILVLLWVLMMVIFLSLFGPWLQAYMSGLQISLLQMIGMKFRKTNPRVVVRALIVAKHGGVDVSVDDMERAYLQGVDLEKVTLAMIQAKKENMDVTFQELVDADLEDRLAEKLGR